MVKIGQSLQVLSKQERLERWSGKIAACRGSGLTVRAWCQKNGISEKTYYYWQRRLFQELTRAQAQSNGFADITLRKVGGSCRIAARVHISGLEVEIYNGADAVIYSVAGITNRNIRIVAMRDAYWETVGFKLAHLWGFLWGNAFFPEVIPGYTPDTALTARYAQMVRMDIGFPIRVLT